MINYKSIIKKLYLSSGIKNWLVHLISIILAFGGIDQVLFRFNIDIKKFINFDFTHLILMCVIFSLIYEIYVLSLNANNKDDSVTPNIKFAKSIISYLTYLRSINKNFSVIELRNNLTHFFHLQGLNHYREKMGKIAFKSAVHVNDDLSKSEILIDDLGWNAHLQNRTNDAIININKAINILDSKEPVNPNEIVRCQTFLVKAHRHLALLSNSQEIQSEHISTCLTIISKLEQNETLFQAYKNKICCEVAQIYHTQSILIAKKYNIHKEGTLPNAKTCRDEVDFALQQLKHAIKIFNEINDLEREVKCLVLLKRLYESINDNAEVFEIDAMIEKVHSKSGINESLYMLASANL